MVGTVADVTEARGPAEIHRVHLEQAKRLLIDTELAMPSIASRSGLTDDRQLLRLLRKREGSTPGAYRRSFRPE